MVTDWERIYATAFNTLDSLTMVDVTLNTYNGRITVHVRFRFQIHYLRIGYKHFDYANRCNTQQNFYYCSKCNAPFNWVDYYNFSSYGLTVNG